MWLKVHHSTEAVSTQDTCWRLLIPLKLHDTTVYNLCQNFGYIWLFLSEAHFLLIFRELFSISHQFHPIRLFLSHLIFLLHFIFFCNCYYPLAFSNLCCSIYLAELQGKSKIHAILLCSRESKMHSVGLLRTIALENMDMLIFVSSMISVCFLKNW